MSFRRRLVIISAGAVAVAVVLASGVVYTVVRAELRGRVDSELRSQAGDVFTVVAPAPGKADATFTIRDGRPVAGPVSGRVKVISPARTPRTQRLGQRVIVPPGPLGGPALYAQFVSANGHILRPPDSKIKLPATARVRRVAAGRAKPFFSETRVNGVHVRIYTSRAGPGEAIQAVRSLDEVDRTVRRLGLVLLAVCLGGVALAGGLGFFVSRTALTPVAHLTEAAEDVARTQDLSRRIDAGGDDELARLARSFNTMLAALEQSVSAQRRLVADASHELRTPITSLRTNIEVLARGDGLAAAERERLLGDVSAQLAELSALVRDLLDTAREDEGEPRPSAVRLDEVVTEAVERMRRADRGVRFELRARPSTVLGLAGALDRAVSNLLDNAAKWSPPGCVVEVAVGDGEVTVRDHGPGIAPDDLPYVFERFYRADVARGAPGAGLGLAIVRQVAEAHGGHVEAAVACGGGAMLRLSLPEEAQLPRRRVAPKTRRRAPSA
jgi:two-component system, OmpR family, sensor histidine kinase MprB